MDLEVQEIITALEYNDNHQDATICVICGKRVDITNPLRPPDTCCRKCSAKLSHITRGWRVTRICPICKQEYEVLNKERNWRVTCGNKDCNKKHRANKMSGESNHQYGLKGEKNSSFKGGKSTKKGYVVIKCPDHPNADSTGYVKEHILVMTKHIGRALDTSIECVHHIDGNKTNNEISNLQLMLKSDHIRLHNKEHEIIRGEDGRIQKVLKKK